MDWIDAFMEASGDIHSPAIFRLWVGISTVAGVLQRRCYTYTVANVEPLCPNLYILLVGEPSTGKGNAITLAKQLWTRVKGLRLAPDNPTKASFFERLDNAERVFMNGSNEVEIFHSLAAPIPEFGVFIPRYDMEFISDLSHVFDNPPKYDKPRTSVRSFDIDKPNLNIVGGATPDFMNDLFPEAAWGQGFTSRFVFVFSAQVKFDYTDYFTKRIKTPLDSLVPALKSFYELGGEFEWSKEAAEAHINWLEAGEPGAPEHSKLKSYLGRRKTVLPKLAMISAVAAGHRLFVTLEDYTRAHSWLTEVEAVMPDVFRSMAQKSDSQLVHDLYEHVYREYAKQVVQLRVPIPDEFLWKFLRDRTPSSNIPKIIETAERSGMIRRAPGVSVSPRWIPRPLHEHARV